MKTEVMKLQDYLHLYLGCEVKVNEWAYKSKLVEIHSNFVIVEDAFRTKIFFDGFKLILRPLSDATFEECIYVAEILGHAISETKPDIILKSKGKAFLEAYGLDVIKSPVVAANLTKYLLSRHFDLFNLIENNLAINSTTLK